MSTAPTAEAAPAKSSKKLIIIIAVAVLVLAGGGGAAMMLLKKKAADGDAEAEDAAAAPKAAAAAKHKPGVAPTFVPLDPFTVNLADRDADRYAQVGITLEIDDAHMADQIKAYMPAIRNNILMAIADRTAAELLGREGKGRLAEKIRREASRALGAEVEEETEDPEAADKPAKAEKPAKGKKAKKKEPAALPINAVHFSNFIVQ